MSKHRDDGRDFYLGDTFTTIERVPARSHVDDLAKMVGIYGLFLIFCLVIASIYVF